MVRCRRDLEIGDDPSSNSKQGDPMKLETIGIDLGKTVFHLIGMNQRGDILMKKRLSRTQLVTLLANTPAC